MARRRIVHSEIVQLFAERLKEVRRSRNITQAELAQLTQLPPSYISALENAKAAPGIDLVARLAIALETSVTELLPMPTTPATSENHREETKQLFENILQVADRDVLLTLKSLLALFRELCTKRR